MDRLVRAGGPFVSLPPASDYTWRKHRAYGYAAGVGTDISRPGGIFMRAEWAIEVNTNTVRAVLAI